MTNALNELHGRIDQRTRQRGRGGRHFFAQAQAQALLVIRRSRELTDADQPEIILLGLWHVAQQMGLEPLFEKRVGQSLLRVVCTDEQWSKILEAAQ